jgi:hypothetical protein
MATFPQSPRDITAEMYLSGDWVDVTAAVRGDPGIDVNVARPNESSEPQPSTCNLVLNNRTGNYSPRNPNGAYFGSIGRNTPLRIAVNQIRDTFARTVASGWGSSDTGLAWDTVGAGGVIAASDYSVVSGVGKHSVPVANAYRMTYMAVSSFYNLDVAVTVTLPFTNVTGGAVEPANIILRGLSISEYYIFRVAVAADESISLQLMHVGGTVYAGPTTVTGLTHSSVQALRVRVNLESQMFRGKIWAASGVEPAGWQVTADVDFTDPPGWVGIRSGVSAGNTNAPPTIFSYDNLVVRQMRFTGEVAAWPQRWDTSGTDIYAPVEAAGISRRLRQGTDPLQSTLYRGLTTLTTPPVAYWPCEDGSDSSQVASALGGPPMFVGGDMTFASFAGLPASLPMILLENGSLVGAVPNYTGTGKAQLRLIASFPDSPSNPDYPIAALIVSGTAPKWEIKYSTGGALQVEAWGSAGSILDTGPVAFDVDGKTLMLHLELSQSGGNINWSLGTLGPELDVGLTWTGTLVGRTIKQAQRVIVTEYQNITDLAVGHVNVRKEITNLFDLRTELKAWTGETAIARMIRLCALRGVPFGYTGLPQDSMPMGPQHAEGFTALLTECAEADGGTLYDSHSDLGLMYRSRTSAYNQFDRFSASYTGHQLVQPLEPTDDDQLTRNDITVFRRDGASSRAQLVTGRMSVLDAADGGVGRYATQITVNIARDDLLDDISGWELHKGTIDETRYPRVTLNLTTPAVVADPVLSINLMDITPDDRFSITNPKTGQTPDTIVQLARGYYEHISNLEHTIGINAAPGLVYDVFIFDEDTSFASKWTTDESSLTAGVTSAATSLSVATPSGTLWTTSAGDMPIPITIAGERMSVTAVSGTTSPQTFTVIRSVNGIVKAQASGDAVALTNTPTWGL